MTVTLVDGGVSAWWLEAETDPNGLPLVAYMTEDSSVHVLKCRDVNCEGGVDELTMGFSEGFDEALDFDLALFPDGSPVMVVQSWGYGYATVHTCLDPACEEFTLVELGDPEPCVYEDGRQCEFSVDFPEIAVGSDGLARVAYLTQTNPAKVKVATCQDRACDGWQLETAAELPADSGTGEFSFHIDEQDRAIVGYWWDQGYDIQGTAVTVCEDASCASEPALVFEVEGAVLPAITDLPDDDFLVWYVTGAPGLPPELATPEAMEQGVSAFPSIYSDYSDTMVASCNPDGCENAQYVPPGEDWVQPFRVNLRVVTFKDGNAGAVFHHASRNEPAPQVHITICSDPTCSNGETRPLNIGVDGGQHRGLDVIIASESPPRVVYTADGGLHLYTCPTTPSTP